MMLKKAAIAGVTVAAALLLSPGAANAIEIPEPPAVEHPAVTVVEEELAAVQKDPGAAVQGHLSAVQEDPGAVVEGEVATVEGEAAAVEQEAGGFLAFLHSIFG